MVSALYDRICGWMFMAMAILGFTVGRLGDFMRFSLWESGINLCVWLVTVSAARLRHRYAVLSALFAGVFLFLWGLFSLSMPQTVLGTTEPLEGALRLVAGAWGMYAAVHDVLSWRNAVDGQAS